MYAMNTYDYGTRWIAGANAEGRSGVHTNPNFLLAAAGIWGNKVQKKSEAPKADLMDSRNSELKELLGRSTIVPAGLEKGGKLY